MGNNPRGPLVERVVRAMFKRSADPKHPDNALDADWQAGYLLGKLTEKDSDEDITPEWKRRGKPKSPFSKPFRNWKEGYWAGRFTKLLSHEQKKETK